MQLVRVERGVELRNDDGERIGYITCTDRGDGVWTIDHTVVDPAYQGQGLAAKLVDELVAMARERGVKLLPVCSYAVLRFRRRPDYADVQA
ncbi:GNAT family N-acetyltransferase [Alicyclobacillus acidocaldarius]|uniref:GNAT family N-acetyltransferase n=1 Tax=Alicyclobacillus acidocaldarius TaxID=405212 RepID=UPI00018A7897